MAKATRTLTEQNEDHWIGEMHKALRSDTKRADHAAYTALFHKNNKDPKAKPLDYFKWLFQTLNVPVEYHSLIGTHFSNRKKAKRATAIQPSAQSEIQEQKNFADFDSEQRARRNYLTELGGGNYQLGVYFEQLYQYG